MIKNRMQFWMLLLQKSGREYGHYEARCRCNQDMFSFRCASIFFTIICLEYLQFGGHSIRRKVLPDCSYGQSERCVSYRNSRDICRPRRVSNTYLNISIDFIASRYLERDSPSHSITCILARPPNDEKHLILCKNCHP